MLQDKKQQSEEDIKRLYITPALENKWDKYKISMEETFTDGRINIAGNKVVRDTPSKADYLLYLNANTPIAVVEAKSNSHTVSYGLQQAITYAQMLDLPFAYSSNGDAFMEHDFLTGQERQLALDEFPTMDELVKRYKEGKNITPSEETIINQPYYSSQNTYEPRYYQRNAINRTVNAIAKGQNRILLVMATGTGKTYTAFQIVYRLLQSKTKKKILYLADRNNLVDQSIEQDFAPLNSVIHKVNYAKDDPTTISAYNVFFSLYQQLAGNEESDEEEDGDELMSRISKLFSKDFFDLVIVDECHRGSASKDSNWRKVLEYFSSATQIGMTATPKETKDVSNIDYFGDPIYTYSLKQGIEDGFLAPFKVINITTDISEGWRPKLGQKDINSEPIEDRVYMNSDFDYNIILQDRTEQVAQEITKYLKATGRMQKTIVFCANEDHAERMRIALNNLNSDMVQQNPDYVVRITGSDDYGKSKLDYFISVSSEYPVIATTSKLLSTGSDCKMTKLIVLDEWIKSMTEFKQIIGRGTRVREKEGKMSFTVMDFRNITRLFSDPDWDGPITIVDGFNDDDDDFTLDGGGSPDDDNPTIPTLPKYKPIVDKDGCRVEIINKKVSVYDANGKLLRVVSIQDYTKTNIIGEYSTLDRFINSWSDIDKTLAIKRLLDEKGIDLNLLKKEEGMEDVDDFDYICHIAYDQKPLTRKERANNVKKSDFLSKYNGVAKEVLETLLDTYMNEGIYEIETTKVLKLEQFQKFGSSSKIASYFGGRDGYMQAVQSLQNEIYKGA